MNLLLVVALLGICHRIIVCKRRPSGLHSRQQRPIPSNPRTVGDFIRKKRVESGASQPQMAEIVGVSTWTVKQWEHNRFKPARRLHERVVEALLEDIYLGSGLPRHSEMSCNSSCSHLAAGSRAPQLRSVKPDETSPGTAVLISRSPGAPPPPYCSTRATLAGSGRAP